MSHFLSFYLFVNNITLSGNNIHLTLSVLLCFGGVSCLSQTRNEGSSFLCERKTQTVKIHFHRIRI